MGPSKGVVGARFEWRSLTVAALPLSHFKNLMLARVGAERPFASRIGPAGTGLQAGGTGLEAGGTGLEAGGTGLQPRAASLGAGNDRRRRQGSRRPRPCRQGRRRAARRPRRAPCRRCTPRARLGGEVVAGSDGCGGRAVACHSRASGCRTAPSPAKRARYCPSPRTCATLERAAVAPLHGGRGREEDEAPRARALGRLGDGLVDLAVLAQHRRVVPVQA
jgi:hypothetical protein